MNKRKIAAVLPKATKSQNIKIHELIKDFK